jgi:hypothetical protein
MTHPAKALQNLIKQCSIREGDARDNELIAATGAFLSLATNDEALLRDAALHLATLPPAGAAWLALTFGTAVENGAEVELGLAELLQLFDAWCGQVAKDEDEAYADVAQAFPSLCQALVAHLARAPARRAALANNLGFLKSVNAAQGSSYGATWVRQAVEKSSGGLIAFHAPSRQGLRLRYTNVSNCFHLFSLLQTAVGQRLPGGQKPDQELAAVARDRADGKCSDAAWWHYADALTNKPHIGASLWGEMLVSHIPRIDQQLIILLWPKLLGSRSWDSSFFHPHLAAMPADVVIESELTAHECAALATRLRLD